MTFDDYSKVDPMNRNHRFTLGVFIALWLFAGSVAASDMRSSVNTSRIGMGDSFELTLSVDAAHASAAPDLAPLQRDFRILGTSQNSRIDIINGQRSESYSWAITLSPKEKGRLTIPAITAGRASSKPLTIEVVDVSELPAGTTGNGELSMEVTADPGTHYVQEEIPVTVRIRSGDSILQASLEEPVGTDFELTRTGEDRVSNTTHDGREFTIIERHYYLKPQKSGKIILPPLTLTATVESSADPGASIFSSLGMPGGMLRMPSGSSLFTDLFNTGRPVSVRSEPLELDVNPRPTGDAVWFLPAKRVELQAEWEPRHPEFRVGEAVTRTISLFALGAAPEQLPDIQLTDADGARIYLDRTSDKTADTDDGTAVIRQFKVSVIPTHSGEINLPAIDVRWWDTVADRERIASLPAETLTVLPGTGQSPDPVTPQVTASSQPGIPDSTDANSTPDPATEPLAAGISMRRWAEVALAALFAFALAAGAWLMNRRRRVDGPTAAHPRPHATHIPPAETGAPIREQAVSALPAHEQAFIRACKTNDPISAYAALNAWLRTAPRLESAIPAALTAELSAMETLLYAPDGERSWNGRQALRAFEKAKAAWRRSVHPAADHGGIPGLYPA